MREHFVLDDDAQDLDDAIDQTEHGTKSLTHVGKGEDGIVKAMCFD